MCHVVADDSRRSCRGEPFWRRVVQGCELAGGDVQRAKRAVSAPEPTDTIKLQVDKDLRAIGRKSPRGQYSGFGEGVADQEARLAGGDGGYVEIGGERDLSRLLRLIGK